MKLRLFLSLVAIEKGIGIGQFSEVQLLPGEVIFPKTDDEYYFENMVIFMRHIYEHMFLSKYEQMTFLTSLRSS